MLSQLNAIFGRSVSFKDYTSSQCGLIGFGAALGAGALIALCVYQKYRRKKRKMSSFPDVSNNVTVMGKYLTPDIFSRLKDKYTSRQYCLDDLIRSGLTCHVSDENTTNLLRLIENPSGLLAGDEECYDVFRDLIDPVVSEVHRISHLYAFTSKVNMDWTEIEGGKLNGTKVISCRLSTSRNIRHFNLIPGCSELELERIGRLIMTTLRSLKVSCEWHLIFCDVSSADVLPQQQHTMTFTSDHYLDPGPLPQQLSRDWPKGRFVWWTEDRRCRILGNFRDHIKLVVTQPGGDMLQAFRRYCELLASIQEALASSGKEFMWSPKYGFLTSSPKDLGTGLHVEVKVRFAKLIEDPRLPRIIDVLPVDLEKGVDPKNGSIACVTNKHKINLSEVEIVQQVVNSVTLLLELDKRLKRKENVKDLLP